MDNKYSEYTDLTGGAQPYQGQQPYQSQPYQGQPYQSQPPYQAQQSSYQSFQPFEAEEPYQATQAFQPVQASAQPVAKANKSNMAKASHEAHASHASQQPKPHKAHKSNKALKSNPNQKKGSGKFANFFKKIGVTNPLLQVALPVALALVVVVIASCAYYNSTQAAYGIKKEVSVTYDTPLTVDLFMEDGADASKASFVSDVSVIDMSMIATYQLVVANDGHKVTTILNVIDDVPPVAEVVPQMVYSMEMPDPNDCITNLQDKSAVTVDYVDEAVDLSVGGSLIVKIKLTDEYGNQTILEVPFTVTTDFNPPVIVGAHDIEFRAGQVPDYTDGVAVTDDVDPKPQLFVDDTEVDPMTEGEYTLMYLASDHAGNEACVTVTVTVLEGDGTVSPTQGGTGGGGSSGSKKDYTNSTTADAYAKARSVVNSICKSSMNNVQKGLKIFYWVNHNIAFSISTKNHTSWQAAACTAFGNRRSDCYGQWAACKAMCDIVGIPNRKVWRTGNNRTHVWCLCYLNGGWYHCDATQWPGRGHWFAYMMTDAEIKAAPGNHKFLASALPERATESVQKYINIYSCTVSSSMKIIATPTPEPTEEAPTTSAPTAAPSTAAPTAAPSTAAPTHAAPTTAAPTKAPPTESPSEPTEKPEDPTDPPEEQTGDQNEG